MAIGINEIKCRTVDQTGSMEYGFSNLIISKVLELGGLFNLCMRPYNIKL